MESNQLQNMVKRSSDRFQDLNINDHCDDSMELNQLQNMAKRSSDLLQDLNTDSMESNQLLNMAKPSSDQSEDLNSDDDHKWCAKVRKFAQTMNLSHLPWDEIEYLACCPDEHNTDACCVGREPNYRDMIEKSAEDVQSEDEWPEGTPAWWIELMKNPDVALEENFKFPDED